MNQLSLLKQLVQINSSYPQESEIAGFLEKYLKKIGFRTQTQIIEDDRKNILAKKGDKDYSILFYGHIDTVVPPSDWDNPYTPKEKGSKLYGLGSYDMKSGIVAFLSALQRFTPENISVKVALGVDEEYISKGAFEMVHNKKAFFKDVKFIINPEPNFGNGLHSITIGRTGRAIFDVSFKGESAHIINAKKAIDAIEQMNIFLYEFYKQPPVSHPHLGQSLKFVRKIRGESVDMIIPGEASCNIECIMVPPENLISIKNSLIDLGLKLKKEKKLKILPRVTPIFRETPFLEPFYQDPKKLPFRDILGHVIKSSLNKEVNFHTRVSVSDENVFALLNIPVISWGPDGGNAHVANEFVEIDSISKLSDMFLQFLQEVDKKPIK